MKEIKFLSISPTLKVSHNDQPIEVGQWYNADVNFIIGKKNESHLGEPLGSIRYVAREDNIISNEAVHTVNFPPDKTRPPYSSGKTLIITNDEEVDLSQAIPLNNTFDRVRIVNFSNVGELLYKGARINPGALFMVYELSDLKFKPSTGTGLPYQTITFQVGNKEVYSTSYELKLNIDGKAKLEDPTIVQPTLGYRTSSANLKVVNARVNKPVQIEVVFETQSLQIYDPINQGAVVIQERDIDSSGVYTFDGVANEKGEFEINLSVSSENIITDGSFYFKVSLLSVDNNENLVGTINEKVIVLNL